MTAPTASRAAPPPATAPGTTTGTRGRSRAARFGVWVVVVVVGVLLATATAAVQGRDTDGPRPLDPTSTTATGSRALVRVLEERGTEVTVVHDAARVGAGTVLVDDQDGVLAPATARRLARTASHVVLVSTAPDVLDAVGVPVTGTRRLDDGGTASTVGCGIPAVAAAGRVSTGGIAWAVPASVDDRCAPTGSGGDRVWSVVRTRSPGGDVTLLGTTSALENRTITTAGNAALALGLLGAEDHLTWYVPEAGTADAAPSLGALAPPWVPSAIAVLGVVALAAAVWRGRRLGPLVVERLPVVVRAAETTEGRARLYARTRDRTHALDTLRVAAVRRTARALGLPRSAHVDEVVRAAAGATGRTDADVGRVLVGGPVRDDRALVAGAAALDDLERAVRRASAGQPTPPPTSSPHRRPGGRP